MSILKDFYEEYNDKIKELEENNKKLKTENEKLDQENQELFNDKLKLDDLVKELRAENEQLKALCDTYKTCYQAKHSDIKCLLPKYRTTLQELKAIAEREISLTAEGDELWDVFSEILQIITKAESEG